MCTGHASVSVKKRWSKVQTQAEKNSTRNYSKYNKICESPWKGLVTYFYLLIHTSLFAEADGTSESGTAGEELLLESV